MTTPVSVMLRLVGGLQLVPHSLDRRIGRAEFSEVFAPLFSRQSSNKARKWTQGDSNP